MRRRPRQWRTARWFGHRGGRRGVRRVGSRRGRRRRIRTSRSCWHARELRREPLAAWSSAGGCRIPTGRSSNTGGASDEKRCGGPGDQSHGSGEDRDADGGGSDHHRRRGAHPGPGVGEPVIRGGWPPPPAAGQRRPPGQQPPPSPPWRGTWAEPTPAPIPARTPRRRATPASRPTPPARSGSGPPPRSAQPREARTARLDATPGTP